jgi:hypothetical protein
MATVTLRKSGPNRLNTMGYLFEKGIPVRDVPTSVAEELEEHDRYGEHFSVRYDKGEQDAPIPVSQTAKKAAAAPQEAGEGDDAGEGEGEGQEASAGKRPSTEKERLAAIAQAIDDLDPDVEGNFTSTGKPDARALTSVLGWQVTGVDRDKALKSMGHADVKRGDAETAKPARNVTVTRRSKTQDPELLDTAGKGDISQADLGNGDDEGGVEV